MDRYCILFLSKTKAHCFICAASCDTVCEVNRFHLYIHFAVIFLDCCLHYSYDVQQNPSLQKWVTHGLYIFPQLHLCFCSSSDQLQPVWVHVCLHAISAHECPTTNCCKYLFRWFNGSFPNDTLSSPTYSWFSIITEVIGLAESHTVLLTHTIIAH